MKMVPVEVAWWLVEAWKLERAVHHQGSSGQSARNTTSMNNTTRLRALNQLDLKVNSCFVKVLEKASCKISGYITFETVDHHFSHGMWKFNFAPNWQCLIFDPMQATMATEMTYDWIVPGTLQPGGDSWKLPVVKVYSPTASPASTSFRRCFSEDVPPSSRCSSTRTLPPDNDDFDKTTKEGASHKGTSAKTHVQTSLGNFERWIHGAYVNVRLRTLPCQIVPPMVGLVTLVLLFSREVYRKRTATQSRQFMYVLEKWMRAIGKHLCDTLTSLKTLIDDTFVTIASFIWGYLWKFFSYPRNLKWLEIVSAMALGFWTPCFI